jgi:membrane fusion protein (multidrug efflux system)
LMVSVPARMLPLLHPGETPVSVMTDAYPDRVFQCTLGRVFPTVNPATRTATVEILLENERNGNGLWLLRPGMYATTEIRSVGHKNALLLPAASILRVLDRQIVFVIEGDVARARNVTVGIRSGDMVEILEGMQDGEEYVVTGQNKLTDGVKVERVNSLTSQSSSESAL